MKAVSKSHSSNVVFSKSFMEFLCKIKKQSRIARVIVSCVSLRENNLGQVADLVLTTEHVNYITYRSNGMISYMPAGKEQKIKSDGTWSLEGRQEGKPSKVIRKIFTKKALKCFHEVDFEIFNNRYKSEFIDHGFEFKVLDAECIPGIYDYANQSDNGSLGGSCMKNMRDLVEFYTRVPGLRIVALFNPKVQNEDNEPELVGRALLWKAKRRDGVEIDFMDRIYCTDEILYSVFIKYAHENGWWTRVRYNSREEPDYLVNPSTHDHEYWDLTVDVDTEGGPWPYLDTFSYGQSWRLQNFKGSDFHQASYEFRCTDGERYVWCKFVKEYVPEEHLIEIGYGKFQGDRAYHDQVIYSEYHECYLLRSEAYEAGGAIYHQSVVRRVA